MPRWRPSLLIVHTGLNLLGAGLPMLVSIPCLGIMARTLDTSSFSLFLLAWALVGYAGILDLGLSRAVTTIISRTTTNAATHRQILSTAVLLAFGAGLVGALVLATLSPWIVVDLAKVPAVQQAQAVAGFQLVGATLPFLLTYLVVQGYWDGREQFAEANFQRVVSGASPLLLATLAILIRPTFSNAMLGILAGRISVFFLILLRKNLFSTIRLSAFSRAAAGHLLGFGGWITYSNSITPIMGTLDRYILAFARGSSSIAFYAAPSEIVQKLLIFPVAITRSLYPKLIGASTFAEKKALLQTAYRLVLLISMPLTILILILAPLILKYWLGSNFQTNSTDALRILALGFFSCALAQVPFSVIHAASQPRLTAMIHTTEVIPFIGLAYYLSLRFGVIGIACAWSLRCTADLIILWLFSRRFTK